MSRFTIALACLALAVAGCGGDDEPDTAATTTPTAAAADLGAIKAYLLEHTERLNTSVAQLQSDAQAYYDLAEAADFDYEKLLSEQRPEVAARGQGASRTPTSRPTRTTRRWRASSPACRSSPTTT